MANQYTLKNGGYEPFIGNFGLVPQPPIPEPAAEDNGKVLGVSDGSYALVNGGGGGGTGMVVDVTVGEDDESFINCPSDELYEAFNSGTNIVVRDATMGPTMLMQLFGALIGTQDGNNVYTFFVERGDPTGVVQSVVFEGINDLPPALSGGDEPTPVPDPTVI